MNKTWMMGLALCPLLAWAQASAPAPAFAPASAPVPARTRAPSKIVEQPRAQPSGQPPHAQPHARAPAKITVLPRASAPQQAHAQSHVPSRTRAPAKITTQRSAHSPSLPYARHHAHTPVKIVGTVWQPDLAHTRPAGNWQKLGAHSLMVQWSLAGDVAFVPGCGGQLADTPPDWARIAAEPWAREIIMGLAGDYSETAVRRSLPRMIQASLCLARLHWPMHIGAWYFPAEIDPTWTQAAQLRPLLAHLPRPLWVSAYDNTKHGPAALCRLLKSSLPPDVGVFFQDGVGVHARTAALAHDYVHALRQCMGAHHHVRLIVEAVRPLPEGGFRAATAQELKAQLAAYGGEQVWLFEGPHYLNADLVEAIAPASPKK